MDRRIFLKTLGVASLAVSSPALLSACGDGAGGIPTGDPVLNVVNASWETLSGEGRRVAFGVRTMENVPVEDRGFEVWVRDMEGEVVGGPWTAEYHDEAGTVFGVYVAEVDLAEEGPHEFVAVDGDEWGSALVNVVAPENSAVTAPGDEAIASTTPTVADDMGLAELCTQEPDCGMHDVSLDEALEAGRPIMLMFATPAYCQTAVCGPAVQTLDEVRESDDWGDTAFIHVEIFSDAGETVIDPVREWELPSEPWLFAIGPDARIVDRLDGQMPRTLMAQMATELNGGTA